MAIRRSLAVSAACLLLLPAACAVEPAGTDPRAAPLVWAVDSLSRIGGYPVEVSGEPALVEAPFGKAVMFDGDGDRLLVPHNPLHGAAEFTLEVVFKPADAWPANTEPRFLHIESGENPDRRVTVELRLNDARQWYLDAFIKAEHSQHTLIDETLTHPVDTWAHAAITYRDRVFTSYVNGARELAAETDYLPIPASARTSIGSRLNKVHWFNGAIGYLAVTHKALKPDEFALLPVLAQ